MARCNNKLTMARWKGQRRDWPPPFSKSPAPPRDSWYLRPGLAAEGCAGPRQSPSKTRRANLTGLVLGCIEAKFCKKICVWTLSPRSTQCIPLHRFWNPYRSLISIFSLKIAEIFAAFFKRILQILPKFC